MTRKFLDTQDAYIKDEVNAPAYHDIINDIIAFYDVAIDHYLLLVPRQCDEHRLLASNIVELCKQRRYNTIIDIACSYGSLINVLSNMRDDLILFGSDVHSRALLNARRSLPAHIRLSHVDWLRLSTTFPCSSFDLVVCTGNSLTHIPQTYWPQMFEQVLNILAPHGAFIVDTYRDWTPFESGRLSFSPRGARIRNGTLEVAFIANLPLPYAIERHVSFARYNIDSEDIWIPSWHQSLMIRHYYARPAQIIKQLSDSGFIEPLVMESSSSIFLPIVAYKPT